MRKEIVPILSMLFLTSVLATLLVVARWFYSGRLVFYSLIWDLSLAWLPLLIAFVAVALRRMPALLWLVGAVWLLFYPTHRTYSLSSCTWGAGMTRHFGMI